jgi:hypothetical protein
MSRKLVDYTVDLDEGLEMYDQAEERAMERLEADGLGLPERPPKGRDGSTFAGVLPNNLASLSPGEIGDFYNLMINYTDYVAGRAILAKTALNSAQEKLKLTKAKVRKAKTGAAKDKDDDTLLDMRYVESMADVIELETYFAIASANETAARRDVAFISRIIETKRMELDQGRRSENMRPTKAFNKGGRRRRS